MLGGEWLEPFKTVVVRICVRCRTGACEKCKINIVSRITPVNEGTEVIANGGS